MINVTKSDLPPIEEYVKYLEKIWESRWITNDGEYVQLLAKKLEDFLKIKGLALVSNGTLALQIALKAYALRGEVITTPFTFAATTNAIIWEGLTPVFADIDPETFNLNPADVERKITKKTCAILAVHVYGNPCAVDELQEIANKHNLKVIYDAAHAFGTEYKNQSILNFGDISTLSFHATKVFNTIEGGAVVAKDEKLLEKLKLLRNHGIRSEEEIILPGTNAKMNEFQAAMGLCNLGYIDEKIQRRKELYDNYKEKLSERGVMFQKTTSSKHNYGYMPACFEDAAKRDEIFTELVKNAIEPRKYFFPLTTESDYFKKQGVDLVKKYSLKNALYISNRILCLPLYPDLGMEDANRVIEIVKGKLDAR